MLRFDDLSLRRGTRLLIAGATFTLFRGEKVGITGANGSGKSSLLALVRGDLQPEAGAIEMPPGLAIAHVSQDLEATDREAIELVLDGDAELRAIARPGGISIAPASGCRSPRTRASRLDLPLPFAPVMPTFSPRKSVNVAPPMSSRVPRRRDTSSNRSISTISAERRLQDTGPGRGVAAP